MRGRFLSWASIMALALTAACASPPVVEQLQGSANGIEVKIANLRDGTRVALVGQRTDVIGDATIANGWARFRVDQRAAALRDHPDQCMALFVRPDGPVVPSKETPLEFRNPLWPQIQALELKEYQLQSVMRDI